MISKEEIKRILESKLSRYELEDFYIDEIVRKPNACGCVAVCNKWFIYDKLDEYCNLSLTGPFNDTEIIYACARVLGKGNLYKEFRTEEFLNIYLHNHFSSVEEIKEKYGK